MSRKDPRKSLSICPDRAVWVVLKSRAGCSMADAVRAAVDGVDWMGVPVGTAGKGTELSLQLPAKELVLLEDAARARCVSADLLVLGALSEALS